MYEVRRSLITRAILDYLRKHPDAQDTVDGITDWWLPEQKIKSRAATVREALNVLVAEGLLLARKSKDSQIHYRINRRKAKEIAARLKVE
jgi:Fe2+ or Zn2+ uptake regulation protein